MLSKPNPCLELLTTKGSGLLCMHVLTFVSSSIRVSSQYIISSYFLVAYYRSSSILFEAFRIEARSSNKN